MSAKDNHYRGRFAPSPTGPLHFGSLYTAVASYLHAKSNHGKWLVRIDDLDPFRCKMEYSVQILNTLEQYGLHWDERVFYQHDRFNAYKEALLSLEKSTLLYPCQCSRKQLAKRLDNSLVYDRCCLTNSPPLNEPTSVRIKIPNEIISFQDSLQGSVQQNLGLDVGDFVLFRKDQVYAYHLAVTLDDDEQGITDVFRGYDLLDSTFRQIHLQRLLNIKTPIYTHIPVINDAKGAKLSKQTFAEDVSLLPTTATLLSVLSHLNLNPPEDLKDGSLNDILNWGVAHWSLENLKKQSAIEIKLN